LSFFFAGAEAAFTVFDKIRFEIWMRQGNKRAAPTLKFYKHPEKFFSTVLIGNNLANTLYSTFATVLLITYFRQSIVFILIIFIVLVIGEILPKTLFRSLASRIILQTLLLVNLFYLLFNPFIRFINFFVDKLLSSLKIKHETGVGVLPRDEVEILLKETFITGVVEKYEQKYIANVLGFSESKLIEAIIPRTEMPAAELSASRDDIYRIMEEKGSLFVVIYENSMDDIVGVIFAYDLLDTAKSIQALLKPISYVPETKSSLVLLREFQIQNISVAAVVDEYGGTAGIVTTDDLIEEVFGQFHLKGEGIPEVKALNDHTWLVNARMELDELREIVNLDFSSGEYETVAGYILNKLGRIPKAGEIIHFDKFRVEITKSVKNRIEQVKFIKVLD